MIYLFSVFCFEKQGEGLPEGDLGRAGARGRGGRPPAGKLALFYEINVKKWYLKFIKVIYKKILLL